MVVGAWYDIFAMQQLHLRNGPQHLADLLASSNLSCNTWKTPPLPWRSHKPFPLKYLSKNTLKAAKHLSRKCAREWRRRWPRSKSRSSAKNPKTNICGPCSLASFRQEIGRASCRERACHPVSISVVTDTSKKKKYTIVNT